MKIPLHPGRSIRAVPVYLRYRYRFVYETLKLCRIEQAGKSKAITVIDLSTM